MSRAQNAYRDLIETLNAISWLNVYEEKGLSGSGSYSLEVFRGPFRQDVKIGCTSDYHGYNLTLITTGTTAPDDVNVRIKDITDRIIADRKRGGNAQSTIMLEEGWTPDEEEGRDAFSISTTLEIYIKEVN